MPTVIPDHSWRRRGADAVHGSGRLGCRFPLSHRTVAGAGARHGARLAYQLGGLITSGTARAALAAERWAVTGVLAIT